MHLPEVIVVQCKPHEEWQPAVPNEPSSLAPTLRPKIPVFTSHFIKPTKPLALEEKLISALRRSSLAWKEAQPRVGEHQAPEGG